MVIMRLLTWSIARRQSSTRNTTLEQKKVGILAKVYHFLKIYHHEQKAPGCALKNELNYCKVSWLRTRKSVKDDLDPFFAGHFVALTEFVVMRWKHSASVANLVKSACWGGFFIFNLTRNSIVFNTRSPFAP
jgi:hypothetical protein